MYGRIMMTTDPIYRAFKEALAKNEGDAARYRHDAARSLAMADESDMNVQAIKRSARAMGFDLDQRLDSNFGAIESPPILTEAPDAAQRKGGRKPGGISRSWQNVLWHVRKNGNALRYEDFHSSVKNLNLSISMAAVRERVRRSIKMEYISTNSDGTFAVTDYAIQKFDLDSEMIPHPDAVSENETSPDLESEDAHS
jgi:hypothetical protein